MHLVKNFKIIEWSVNIAVVGITLLIFNEENILQTYII
jgi:hypothetical protein